MSVGGYSEVLHTGGAVSLSSVGRVSTEAVLEARLEVEGADPIGRVSGLASSRGYEVPPLRTLKKSEVAEIVIPIKKKKTKKIAPQTAGTFLL